MLLSEQTKISQGAATTGAGTSDVNGTILDMAGFEGVMFVAKFGTAAANNTIHAEQDTDAAGGTMTALAGSEAALLGASDEIVWLDLNRPRERYVRMVADRGTSTTLDWAVAIQYGARKTPVGNLLAGTIAGEVAKSPAEGAQ